MIKIAVLRANVLGDFIFALPALETLRAAYPDAEIVLLARRWHHAFLTQRPGPIDRVVVIPDGGIGDESDTPQDPLELDRFFAEMRRDRFDIAIQMHGGGRNSNPFTQRLEARLTVGLRSPDAIPLDRWMPYIYYQPEILRYLELVSLVGAKPITLEPRLVVTEADRLEAQHVVSSLKGDRAKVPIVVIHPGASDSRRWWPTEKFAAVGDALAAAGASVAVTGTPAQSRLVEAVVDQMHAKAQNLCGQLSLNGLAGLLSQSSVVVSNDSGPLHLAAAVGTRTVGIYWCGNMITAGPLSRTRHRPTISWRLHCSVCGADCTQAACDHRDSFVADVPTQDVIEPALNLLEANQLVD